MWSFDSSSFLQFCWKWIPSWKTWQHLLIWLAYNYYRDAGRLQPLRSREIRKGLALNAAQMCGEEAAPIQAANSPSPPPPYSCVLGWGQGLSRADLGLPLAAVFCDVTIMMRIDDRTRWFHCLRRQWRPRKNLAEFAGPNSGLIWDPLIPPVTSPHPR